MTNVTFKKHADLVDRMANTLGVDLEEVMMEGRMTMDQLGDAVLSCTGCSCPGDCETWLAARQGSADEAPDYCRNADMLVRLREGKTA
ncbi:hypothetical protein EI983_13235 [Roseovarius faecimaris]|uniref:DUF6455 domain-containing protein n=1 Tax=Roseovarius faecimaris TaxID=2494550 RepID=A0A6I6IUK4_9RHOB|nr:DUF6455 family protein [Roseovarius faecimaris]QGX99177.1 hypothetical protein EI983_13235 [Roseovarius faecimaris]